MKKLLLMLTSMIVICVMVPATVYAASSSQDSGRTEAFSFAKGKALKQLQKKAASYPDAFDLRHVDSDGNGVEESYVTPVKVQNPYGTCWGFAAASAAESSIISNKELNRDSKGNQIFSTSTDQLYNAENLGGDGLPILDLSEKHIAYFATSYLDDPDSSQNGEGTHFNNLTKEDLKTSKYRYDTGGFNLLATSLFASGMGPNFERFTDGTFSETLAYRGKNQERALWRVATEYDANNKPVKYERIPVWYSNQDDWSIPDSERFYQEYRLKDSIVLPSPAGRTENNEYVYVPEATMAIQQQLCENLRAVSINFCAESYLPGQDTSDKKYMSSKWAHYTSEQDWANHSVTIVGWDNNYPKENFLTEPPGDGAWLIKNSWGSELNEFPNNGHRHWGLLEGLDGVPYDENAEPTSTKSTGYFWISYYDESLSDPEAFVFDKPTGENGYYVEQFDFLQVTDISWHMQDKCRMANVFEAEATSTLSEISVMTTIPDTTVNYEIYLLPDTYSGPEDGLKLCEGSQQFEYGGYHKIALPSDQHKVLAKGQKFSVLITETCEGQDYVSDGAAVSPDNYSYVGVINPGESYFYNGENWMDLSEEKTKDVVLSELRYYYPGYDFETDNFPVKAYLEPVVLEDGSVFDGYLSINNWQDGNVGLFGVNIGTPKTITTEFRGLNKDMPEGWDPKISWASQDESIVTLKTSEADDGQAVLNGVSEGNTFIVVEAEGFGIRLLNISVKDPNIQDNTLKVRGKSVKISASKLKKSAVTLPVTRVIAFADKGQGKLSYQKVSGKKKIKVNGKTGKVTVKKGLKKGVYKVTVKVRAAGNESYRPSADQNATFTIKVK